MSIQTDPEAIREFAEELTTMIIFLNGRLADLSSNIARLGRSWQDEQYVQFKMDADRTSAKLAAYLDDLKMIRTQIQADLEAAQAYQRSGGSL